MRRIKKVIKIHCWPCTEEFAGSEYSQEIQHRVAQVGFDWENDQGVIDKLTEEVGEFQRANTKKKRV